MHYGSKAFHCIAIFLHLQACRMDDKDIEKKCLALADENGKRMIESYGFKTLTQETLKKIISRDTLEVRELDLWLACLKWAAEECRRQQKVVRF